MKAMGDTDPFRLLRSERQTTIDRPGLIRVIREVITLRVTSGTIRCRANKSSTLVQWISKAHSTVAVLEFRRESGSQQLYRDIRVTLALHIPSIYQEGILVLKSQADLCGQAS